MGERIHVGAQTDILWAIARTQHADDGCAVDHAMNLNAPRLQEIGDDVGGAMRFKAEFRMGMYIASNIRQLGMVALNPFERLCGR